MKTKLFLAAAAAVASTVSCASPSDVTKISGTVGLEGIDKVNVIVEQMDIDTLVPVSNGKFSIEIPADVTALGSIEAGEAEVDFIPDGTKLDVTLSNTESAVKSACDYVQSEFSKFEEYAASVSENIKSKVDEIRSDASIAAEQQEEKIEAAYDEILGDFSKYSLEVIKKNADNAIGVVALNNIVDVASDDEIEEAVSGLSDKIKENEFIQRISNSVKARKATAEGKMFTDFTIEDSDGKTVKFSDFVGKGKYVLVDFWASWCGPCKREIPNIKAVYDKYHGPKFDVLSVAVSDRPEDTKAAAKEHGVVWSQIINAQRIPIAIYGIDGIPHIMLIGPDGTILKRGLRGADIEAAVAEYLSK